MISQHLKKIFISLYLRKRFSSSYYQEFVKKEIKKENQTGIRISSIKVFLFVYSDRL